MYIVKISVDSYRQSGTIKTGQITRGVKMKLSLYNSLLTGKRTCLVDASFGKCGHAGYKEIQVMAKNGQWMYNITDGYFTLNTGTFPLTKGLKSVINILEGKAKTL